MKFRTLTFITSLVGFGAVVATACGSSDEDEQPSLIDTGGQGGGAASSGLDGGAASGNTGNTGNTGAVFNQGDGGGIFVDKKEDASCGSVPLEASVNPVNILIVMDKSGSMSDELTAGLTRWDGVKLALQDAISATEANVDFGISVFPYDPDDTGENCAMPTASAPLVPITAGATDESTTILAALNARSPAGGTPTAAALGLALDYFTNGPGAALDGGKYVLLATDGGPNCNVAHAACDPTACTVNIDGACPSVVPNCCDGAVDNCLDDADTIAAVSALQGEGIGTFVVGMPGSEAYEATLDALAEAGGFAGASSPKYFSVSATGGVDALKQTFQDIAVDLIKECDLQLERDPDDASKVFVFIDEVQAGRDDPNGWTLDETTTPPTVRITGAACEDLQANGAESLQIVFGCPEVIRK